MLFTHELVHLFLSLAIGILLAGYFKNKLLIFYALLAGVFADVDHLFDYFLFKKDLSINFPEFFSGVYFDITNKVILPLHGFEYVIILVVLGLFYLRKSRNTTHLSVSNLRKGSVLLAFGISLFFHLAYDTIYYRPKWPTYFIFYRLYNNFDHNTFWN